MQAPVSLISPENTQRPLQAAAPKPKLLDQVRIALRLTALQQEYRTDAKATKPGAQCCPKSQVVIEGASRTREENS